MAAKNNANGQLKYYFLSIDAKSCAYHRHHISGQEQYCINVFCPGGFSVNARVLCNYNKENVTIQNPLRI